MLRKLLLRLSKKLIAYGNGCDIPCECARYRAQLAKRTKENAPYRELQMLLRDYTACLRVHETAKRVANGGPLKLDRPKRSMLWN